ncbi:MAG: hypothetical protein Q8M29_00490 [Bacteroidota bacterium]|nr:hypothetical protein [Bacteroidota bacterium]
MVDDVNSNVNPESILVVTNKGVLKRLRCPFKAILIDECPPLFIYTEYKIQAVLMSGEGLMLFVIEGNKYYYFYFEITT